MSFEKLADRIQGTPEAAAHAAARRAELLRKPWHEAFLAEVYPFWQGPMVAISRKHGVESCTHGVAHDFPPAVNAKDVLNVLPRREWVLAELLTATTVVGAGVVVAYVFSGDENDGLLVRVVGLRDGNVTTLLPQHTKQWSGPKAKVIEAAAGDVDDAKGLFAPLVLEACQAKDERVAREKAEAEAAEKKRREEEEARARAEVEERERVEKAALAEAERLAAEKKASA